MHHGVLERRHLIPVSGAPGGDEESFPVASLVEGSKLSLCCGDRKCDDKVIEELEGIIRFVREIQNTMTAAIAFRGSK